MGSCILIAFAAQLAVLIDLSSSLFSTLEAVAHSIGDCSVRRKERKV